MRVCWQMKRDNGGVSRPGGVSKSLPGEKGGSPVKWLRFWRIVHHALHGTTCMAFERWTELLVTNLDLFPQLSHKMVLLWIGCHHWFYQGKRGCGVCRRESAVGGSLACQHRRHRRRPRRPFRFECPSPLALFWVWHSLRWISVLFCSKRMMQQPNKGMEQKSENQRNHGSF
jgi:hypothetical protein